MSGAGQGPDETGTIRVRAPIDGPGNLPPSEVMHAAPDPAADDQGVLLNAPFLVEWLNYGDIVRLGAEDESGVRPILEVVAASGHARVMVDVGPLEADDLAARLRDRFPTWGLRMEGNGRSLLTVSVHPDLDPEEVAGAMDEWFDGQGVDDEDDDVAISEVMRTVIGPVRGARP